MSNNLQLSQMNCAGFGDITDADFVEKSKDRPIMTEYCTQLSIPEFSSPNSHLPYPKVIPFQEHSCFVTRTNLEILRIVKNLRFFMILMLAAIISFAIYRYLSRNE